MIYSSLINFGANLIDRERNQVTMKLVIRVQIIGMKNGKLTFSISKWSDLFETFE